MRIATHLFAALCLFASSVAQAELRGLFTLGAGFVRFDDGADNVSPTNIYLRLGAALSRYFEAGLEAGITVLADDVNSVDFDVNTRLIYIQGNLPVNDTMQLFLLGGPAQTELTGSGVGGSESLDDDDMAVGGGLRFTIREDFYFLVDYIRYFDDDEFDGFTGDFVTEAINLGVGGYF